GIWRWATGKRPRTEAPARNHAMRIRSAATPLLLLLLAFAGTPARAQLNAGQTPFLEQVEVEVVNVDVRATDSSGKPLTDLGKGHFEPLEDGKPVAITNFEAVTGDRLPAQPAPPPTPTSPSPKTAGTSTPSPPAPLAPIAPIAEEQRLHLVIYVD